MKKILITFLALTVAATSCKDKFDEYGVNPNDPETVTAASLLTGAEVSTFAAYGGQLGRVSSMLVQQTAGTSEGSQTQAFANYTITEADVTNEWANLYNGSLNNTLTLINDYGAENPYYAGMAKILTALNIGVATDLWGDVPYTEAIKALSGNFNPKYDKQEDVIKSIQTLLDEAIVALSTAPTANKFIPGADDLIFGGNTKNWINAAYIIKSRYANRLSQSDPSGSATKALEYLAKVDSSASDMNAMFYNTGNTYNQWYDYYNNRTNYLKMGKFFIDFMATTKDPRLPFFATLDEDGKYSGTPVDDQDQTTTSDPGPAIASADSPIPLATYTEAKFIQAEAQLRLGKTAEAAAAYNIAVTSSVKRVTGSTISADFAKTTASETASSLTLEKLITQKYVALFTQIEPYNDFRRTGFPKLTANPNSSKQQIPLRLPTSQDERVNNPNATVVSDIYTPVWWDK
ncbi:SusD/RagB family nutrient-binding outer membrane lipoprotein [Dyadobacter sp. CY356]|uniref:SusD/RagB family nutrient-binding outer membrane lipoprotein n=1 Tax=Dyadobacter sp. CY356 TaxID=2906442 RepID=UPI001F406BCD|nr:SusD/RagB family nutrient-binding outer membrane lipoprotein [Dyadobacter sp. CY356]MCF0059741.1 SusD/RagB family nutrient-binding outer membrane lipoprotein [Dyadobacter sp. CY356]